MFQTLFIGLKRESRFWELLKKMCVGGEISFHFCPIAFKFVHWHLSSCQRGHGSLSRDTWSIPALACCCNHPVNLHARHSGNSAGIRDLACARGQKQKREFYGALRGWPAEKGSCRVTCTSTALRHMCVFSEPYARFPVQMTLSHKQKLQSTLPSASFEYHLFKLVIAVCIRDRMWRTAGEWRRTQTWFRVRVWCWRRPVHFPDRFGCFFLFCPLSLCRSLLWFCAVCCEDTGRRTKEVILKIIFKGIDVMPSNNHVENLKE